MKKVQELQQPSPIIEVAETPKTPEVIYEPPILEDWQLDLRQKMAYAQEQS